MNRTSILSREVTVREDGEREFLFFMIITHRLDYDGLKFNGNFQ